MIARFVRGAQSLDVSASPLKQLDFIPPQLNPVYNVTGSTSLNHYGGGQFVSEKAEDREIDFRVLVEGGGEITAMQNARRLTTFLKNKIGALYFEFSPLDVPEPTWGYFGAPLRYEVVSADASLGSEYGSYNARQEALIVYVALTVKPVAVMHENRCADATGGIEEVTIGYADGMAHGLRVNAAKTNKYTKPIIGGTAAASLTATTINDQGYCYPGAASSVLLRAAAAVNNTYTTSINAGNTNTHIFTAWVMKAGGGVVDTNDMQIFYNVALATTFTDLGNGVYKAQATAAGINAGTNTGVVVKNGRSVYLLAVDMQETSGTDTGFVHGYALGCAWTGTKDASTSTRTAGKFAITNARYNVERGPAQSLFYAGSVALAWKAAAVTGTQTLFLCNNLKAYLNGNVLTFTDGTYTLTSAALSANTTYRTVFTWGANGLRMYTNGSLTDSDSLTGIPDATIYLGSTAVPDEHFNGIFYHVTTYDTELSAAQVTELDTAISAIVSAGNMTAPIPYTWQYNGDGIDMMLDSTHKNYAVLGGIPGDLPAQLRMVVTVPLPNAIDNDVWIGCTPVGVTDWQNPEYRFYMEGSGAAEVGNSNDDYLSVNIAAGASMTVAASRVLRLGGKVHFFIRARAEAGTATMNAVGQVFANGHSLSTPTKSCALTTDYKLYYIGATYLDPNRTSQITGSNDVTFYVTLSGSAGTARVDFATAIVGDLTKVLIPLGFTQTLEVIAGKPLYTENLTFVVLGDILEPLPNALNMCPLIICDDGAAFALTLDYPTYAYIQPRWSLL